MGIIYHEKSKIFQIHTKNTTYMMGIYAGVHLQHLYYGAKLTDPNCDYLFPRQETPGALHTMKRDVVGFYGAMPFEYPVFGTGDFRGTAMTVRSNAGHRVCSLQYEEHRITNTAISTGMEITTGSPPTEKTGSMIAGRWSARRRMNFC